MSMTHAPPDTQTRIVVAGATLEGWLAAASLARRLRPLGVAVILVPTDADAAPPPALATTPGFRAVHDALRLDERDVARFCGGGFRLGDEILSNDRSFARAFSPAGQACNGVAFHQHWLRARRIGASPPFDNLSVGARAAREGRFAPPAPDADDLAGSYGFGLHLDGARYQEYLRRCALHYGVTEAAPLAEASPDGDGRLDALRLADGSTARAALYLDATGPGALLLRGLAPEPLRPAPDASGCDRVAWSVADAPENLSAGVIRMESRGYAISTPLPGANVVGFVHRADATDAETAARRCGAASADDVTLVSFANAWRPRPWVGDCVAIGRAACDLEPLAHPLPRLVDAALDHLVELFPIAGDEAGGRDEFNRRMDETFARFAEFQALHHVLSAYPKEARAASAPLERKIEQFRSRGRVVLYDHESFDEASHVALYLGFGLLPDRYDPLADLTPPDETAALMTKTRDAVRALCDAMPSQRDALLRMRLLNAERA